MRQIKVLKEFPTFDNFNKVGLIITNKLSQETLNNYVNKLIDGQLEYLIEMGYLELIPENKMEIVGGYTGTYHNGAIYFSKADQVPSTFNPAILINNIDEQTRPILKAIEEGKVYERFTSAAGLNNIHNEKNVELILYSKKYYNEVSEIFYKNKLLIIPIEEVTK